ncbi:MAG: CaiB/BaiF CoA-transferase family protein [Pseudohongiellaceae bacterium]
MDTPKPLTGCTVIDFSAVFAGPICSRFLRDCGAEVIKIEPPGDGDMTRGPTGLTPVYAHFNAGKRSVAINLKHPDGQALARRLVMGAEVVIENFRPGVMTRFGLDYQSFKTQRPDLVYCSISGFGQSGPQVDRAAFAPIIHAASGFDIVHARAQVLSEKASEKSSEKASDKANDLQRPPNWEIMMADMLSGTHAFAAIQSALLGRERYGVGDYIDVSMMDAMMTLIPSQIQAAQMQEPLPIGRYCPVRTRDGYIMVCVVSDKNLRSLSVALQRPDLLTDPRFVFGPRTANQKYLVEEIEKWSATLSASESEQRLNQAGVPCAGYQRPEDLFAHPQVVERKSFTSLKDDILGEFLIQNMPARFSHLDTTAADWVAGLGEHTNEVLGERLQLSQAEIDALRSTGVIA